MKYSLYLIMHRNFVNYWIDSPPLVNRVNIWAVGYGTRDPLHVVRNRILVWALLSGGLHGSDVWLSHSLNHRASEGSCRTAKGRNYIPYLLLRICNWSKLLGRSECWIQEDSWRLRVRMIIYICSRRQVSPTTVWDRDCGWVVAGKSFHPTLPQRQTNPKSTSLSLRTKLAVYCQPLSIIPPEISISPNRTFTF